MCFWWVDVYISFAHGGAYARVRCYFDLLLLAS